MLMVPAPGQETDENQGNEEEYIGGERGYLGMVFSKIMRKYTVVVVVESKVVGGGEMIALRRRFEAAGTCPAGIKKRTTYTSATHSMHYIRLLHLKYLNAMFDIDIDSQDRDIGSCTTMVY